MQESFNVKALKVLEWYPADSVLRHRKFVSVRRVLLSASHVHLTLKGSEGFQSPIPDYEERGIFPAHVPSLWLLMLIPIRMKLVMSSPARRCTPSLTSRLQLLAGFDGGSRSLDFA
jgi:hypothetical protein